MLGRALDTWWEELGRPDPYVVVDAGTGPGTLARQLAAVEGPSAAARTVVGYDHADEPPELSGAVVLANELLDNLPFRVVERTEWGWVEWWVDTGPAGPERRLVRPPSGGEDAAAEPAGSVAAALDALDPPLPVGATAPVLERAADWVADVVARGAARVLVFDYGAATTAELARRGGWLRTYRSHERGEDPFREPGRWDITTDIAVDQLPPPAVVTTQAAFLREHGIDELVEEGRRAWAAAAARPDLRAMRMRSRVNEAEALLDHDGLGGWLCLRWG
ncbi:MAG: SAM-dependent methyltransferase [Actinomycetota bacterium]